MIPLSSSAILSDFGGRISSSLFLLGMGAFAAGFLLMFHHLRQWQQVQSSVRDPRLRLFEYRKFRRRVTVASLVSACGTIMVSTYWIVDPKIFATMIAMLLILLTAILGLASLDLLSVSLQRFGNPDKRAEQAMLKKYLELRRKRAGQSGDEESDDSRSDDDSPLPDR